MHAHVLSLRRGRLQSTGIAQRPALMATALQTPGVAGRVGDTQLGKGVFLPLHGVHRSQGYGKRAVLEGCGESWSIDRRRGAPRQVPDPDGFFPSVHPFVTRKILLWEVLLPRPLEIELRPCGGAGTHDALRMGCDAALQDTATTCHALQMGRARGAPAGARSQGPDRHVSG